MGMSSIDRHGDGARCRKVGQPDRQTAEAVRIGLEIWNRATRGERTELRVVVFRCKKCKKLHVGCQRQKGDRPKSARPNRSTTGYLSRFDRLQSDPREELGRNLDIRYLIEEFDLS